MLVIFVVYVYFILLVIFPFFFFFGVQLHSRKAFWLSLYFHMETYYCKTLCISISMYMYVHPSV